MKATLRTFARSGKHVWIAQDASGTFFVSQGTPQHAWQSLENYVGSLEPGDDATREILSMGVLARKLEGGE